MNINLTLIGQAISFAIFVWFCMRFVWPPVTEALENRRRRIADGLAQAEAAAAERANAAKTAQRMTGEARTEASRILSQAERRAGEIMEEARTAAKAEGERILARANAEIEQNTQQAREGLRREVAGLAIAGAEAVLRREVDAAAHEAALEELAKGL